MSNSKTLCFNLVVDGYCPNGWVSYKDNCFLIKKNTTTWDEADSICRRQGADLASISDRLEQYLVFSQLSEGRTCKFESANGEDCTFQIL